MNRSIHRTATSTPDPADDKGFSLIELLVVIVILGVLASVAVLGVSGVSSKGNTAACKTDIATIQTAADAYFVQFNTGAPDLPTLVSAGLLRSDPKIATAPGTLTRVTDSYTITYTPASPIVSGGGAVTGLLTGNINCAS